MSNQHGKLLEKNKKIDRNVITEAASLNQKLPEFARNKQGANFSISHPLSGSLLVKNVGERTI